jgi:hypothetical protein
MILNGKKCYKNNCKILSKIIILAKKFYYNNKFANSTNKTKTTWSIIKNLINNTIGDLYKINPLNYFYSEFKPSFTNIRIKNTATGEIGKIIKELKSRKSHIYDEITTKIIKMNSPFIVLPLTYIYVTECFQLEIFRN